MGTMYINTSAIDSLIFPGSFSLFVILITRVRQQDQAEAMSGILNNYTMYLSRVWPDNYIWREQMI